MPDKNKAEKSAQVQAGLADYVEVHERLAVFFDKYPDGSLQTDLPQFREVAGQTLVIIRAHAYRHPDDPRPSDGTASEPFPGQTPYTKDSEVMNGETSAWGRALAALGIEVHRGIASGNEVRARGGGADPTEEATKPQIDFLLGKDNRPGLFSKAQLGKGQIAALVQFACGQDELTKVGAGRLITALKENPEKGAAAVLDKLMEAANGGDANALKARAMITDDVPADTSDLPDADEGGQQALEGTPIDDMTLQPDTDAGDEGANPDTSMSPAAEQPLRNETVPGEEAAQ